MSAVALTKPTRTNWTAKSLRSFGREKLLSGPDSLLNAKRTLELANKAYYLYITQNPAEKAQLLKMVASNCRFDGVSFCTTYRKPFDVIFEKAKWKEWRALRDSNSRPSDS